MKKILFILFLLYLSCFFVVKVKWDSKDLSRFLISEEFIFYAEENIGLVQFYKDAKQCFNVGKKENRTQNDSEHTMYFNLLFSKDNVYLSLIRHIRNPVGLIVFSSTPFNESNETKPHIKWKENVLFYSRLPDFLNYNHLRDVWIEVVLLLIIYALYPLSASFGFRKFPRMILTALVLGLFYYYSTSYYDWIKSYDSISLRVAIDTCNKKELNQLFKDRTRIVTMPDNHRLFQDAPLFCGSQDIFETPFLCWKLGNFNYLYYMPSGFQKHMFLSEITKITDLGNNFFLVQYPKYISAINGLFAISHIIFFIPIIIFIIRRLKRRLFPPLTSEETAPASTE